ncbi:unnamed protein product [marine sediment metagenome]|uniref:Uncharacterized protein n=1 Tax=marine sediment metagenome TaxID=412755 RepID=X1TP53_9ZZZZ
MCDLISENSDPLMPTISAVFSYINHQEEQININGFTEHIIEIFGSIENHSEDYEKKLRDRIKIILDFLIDTKVIIIKDNILIKTN